MLSKLKFFIKTHFRIVLFFVVVLVLGGIILGFVLTKNSLDKEKGATTTPKSGSQSQNEQNNSPTEGSQQEPKKETPSNPAQNSKTGNNTTSGSGSTSGTPQSGSSGGDGNTGGTVVKKNCVIKPSDCGYPDGTNTGYQHTGVTLTTDGITINPDGDFIIDQDNTVIDSKRIDGCVVIRAKNVTIKRSLITGCQAFYNIWLQELPGGGIRDTSNFLMEDVEVDGNRYFTNAALVDDNGKGLVVRRMNMHDVADGPHPGENWLIEDSYIHDMYVCPNDCHTDSIQSAGAINVVIRHNTILNNPENNGTGGKNAVVRIATEQSPVSGFIVDNNLLDGGNYAVQVREQGNGAPTGVVVTNNRIVPNWRFAPYDFTDIPVTLSGNFRDDTLEPLNTPM